MPTLPLDILLSIIDLLAAGGDEDIKSLRILSQACKFMVPICRKHLFSSLYLHGKSKSARFSELLSKNPEIARYARRLDYGAYGPMFSHDLNILDTLREHSSLQWLKVRTFPRVHWNNYLPESIRSSMISLIQIPTITHLYLDCLEGFPGTALLRCSNLIELKLQNLKMDPPEVHQIISHSKIPTPVSLIAKRHRCDGLETLMDSATLHACSPAIDFSRLQKLSFNLYFQDEIGPINKLIKLTPRLQYLSIDPYFPVGLAGLGASLAMNAYRTLKSLEICISVIDVGHNHAEDPLCGLSHELSFIAGNNVLEELELGLVVHADSSCRIEAEDWSAFDSVLTKYDAFPLLHRVWVEILWDTLCTKDEEDRVLESFKQVKFPRLAKSKAVEFKFTSEVHHE